MLAHLAIFSLLGATVLAAPAPAHEGVKVPLARRGLDFKNEDGTVDLTRIAGQLRRTLNKYGMHVDWPFDISTTVHSGPVGVEPLASHVKHGIDARYFGVGSVGTDDPQNFTFVFDTGSPWTTVPGPSCGILQGCDGPTKYNLGGIESHAHGRFPYGSIMTDGDNYFDNVQVAGLTARNTSIFSVNRAVSMPGFTSLYTDGFIGMSFPIRRNQATYFETLTRQNTVATHEFSFSLGRAMNGTASASELILGGRNPAKFEGETFQVPVIPSHNGWWSVVLDGVLVDGHPAPLKDQTRHEAAIDTGTTVVVAPLAAAQSIYDSVPGSFAVALTDGPEQHHIYPCSETPTVELIFAGSKFAIDKADFNLGQIGQISAKDAVDFGADDAIVERLRGEDYCLGAIVGHDIRSTPGAWIVGDTFLKSWYSIYSYDNYHGKPSVSFAKARAPTVVE